MTDAAAAPAPATVSAVVEAINSASRTSKLDQFAADLETARDDIAAIKADVAAMRATFDGVREAIEKYGPWIKRAVYGLVLVVASQLGGAEAVGLVKIMFGM